MRHAKPSPEASLSDWLQYLETAHPVAVEFGLERVDAVRRNLGLGLRCPVITVGGTNGKGSTCALLESFLRCAGYRVGCYTSPHLLHYNERVRIAGQPIADRTFVRAFERIEHARSSVSLTYFEFGTLAAALAFEEAGVEAAVLEVGLGGRLDAVNMFDADCSVLTSIGLDHTEYLGATRERIALEKAGILRPGRPAVIGDADPPHALLQRATELGATVRLIDRDFGVKPQPHSWTYWSTVSRRNGLPWPNLRGRHQLGNAACALSALDSLHDVLPVDMGAIRRGLTEVELPGRFQVLPGRPMLILDVAHNPEAATRLRDTLGLMPAGGRRFAVFGMLRDKDISAVAATMKGSIDHWFVAPLPGPRGAGLDILCDALAHGGMDAARYSPAADVASALRMARDAAGADDKIIVFGSFLTVSSALSALGR